MPLAFGSGCPTRRRSFRAQPQLGFYQSPTEHTDSTTVSPVNTPALSLMDSSSMDPLSDDEQLEDSSRRDTRNQTAELREQKEVALRELQCQQEAMRHLELDHRLLQAEHLAAVEAHASMQETLQCECRASIQQLEHTSSLSIMELRGEVQHSKELHQVAVGNLCEVAELLKKYESEQPAPALSDSFSSCTSRPDSPIEVAFTGRE